MATPRKTTTQRGYGAAHMRARKQALAQLTTRPGKCHFCGRTLRAGDDVHLDHTPDRSGYRGLACATCNERDGSNRRWAKAKPKAKPTGSSYSIPRA